MIRRKNRGLVSAQPAPDAPRTRTGNMLLEADLAEPVKEGLYRWIIVIAAVALFGALFIAGITPVHTTVSAEGRLLPAEGTRPMQSEFGGRVIELTAAEGDFVEAGAQIMRFDRAFENAQVAQLRARRAALNLERQVHLAVLEGREFLPERREWPTLAQGQALHFAIKNEATEARLRGFDQDIALAQASIQAADAQLELFGQRRKLLADRVSRLSRLLEQSASVSVVDRDLAQLSLIEAQTEISAAQNAREVGLVSLDRARNARSEFLLNRRQDASQRLTEIDARLAELNEELNRAQSLADQDRLLAPVSGIVQNLSVNSPGQIVSPEVTILEIVPRDEELVAEIQVPASRIGDVRPGMTGHVKIATFDFTRYGALAAEVLSVSPSSEFDAMGIPQYRVRLSLDRDSNPAAGQMLLRSGLALSADLTIGEQTLLTYFLKPLRTLQDRALREA